MGLGGEDKHRMRREDKHGDEGGEDKHGMKVGW